MTLSAGPRSPPARDPHDRSPPGNAPTRDDRPAGVEALRRELAALVLDWAGQAVRDNPDSPLGQTLASAVREAAKSAVSDQYQALSHKDAEHIAEALDQLRSQRGGSLLANLSGKAGLTIGLVLAAALALAFALGVLTGRGGPARRPSMAAQVSAPVIDTYVPETDPAPTPVAAEAPAPKQVVQKPALPVAAARTVVLAPRPRERRPRPTRAEEVGAPGPAAAVSPNASLAPSPEAGATAAAAAAR